MTKALIIKLIMHYSALYGVDGNTALAVAQVESNLNPAMIGEVGEIGLYQIRSEYISDYTREQLFIPEINIKVGMRILADAQKNCIHKKQNQFVICFNMGKTAAKKVKHPELYPYYIKVERKMANL